MRIRVRFVVLFENAFFFSAVTRRGRTMINPAHLPALQLAQRGTDHRLPPLIGPPTASINLLEFSIQAKASLARAAVMREEFDIELEEEMGEEWRRCQIGFGEEMVLEGEAQHDGETSKCPLLRSVRREGGRVRLREVGEQV